MRRGHSGVQCDDVAETLAWDARVASLFVPGTFCYADAACNAHGIAHGIRVKDCLETTRSYERFLIRNGDAYYTHGLAKRARIYGADVGVYHMQKAEPDSSSTYPRARDSYLIGTLNNLRYAGVAGDRRVRRTHVRPRSDAGTKEADASQSRHVTPPRSGVGLGSGAVDVGTGDPGSSPLRSGTEPFSEHETRVLRSIV